jgi:zinc transport system ATP-binding protein
MTLQACDHCCLRIEDLSVSYGSFRAIDHVSLHVNCHELLAIIGPNGAGKSTLLKALIGEAPFSGKVQFRAQGAPSQRFRTGYVPQRLAFDIGAPLSVADLLAGALSSRPVWLGISRTDRAMIVRTLEPVAAAHLLDRRVGELSGGELQRVLLALAMTPPPEILLLDEPVAAVDVKSLSLLYGIVSDLRQRHDMSVILITHDITGIAPYADRMVLLNRTILADGKPDEVLARANQLKIIDPAPLPMAASSPIQVEDR